MRKLAFHKRKAAAMFDPVADWDGKVGVLINGRTVFWTPEQLSENSRQTLAMMERSAQVRAEDAAERCPPRRMARMRWWEPLDG